MENVKKFYKALESDEALRGRADALNEKYKDAMPDEAVIKAELVDFAAVEGYAFTAEELDAYANAPKVIDDEELEAVAGGSSGYSACFCVVGGGGTVNGITCACVFGGGGKGHPGPNLKCIAGGAPGAF